MQIIQTIRDKGAAVVIAVIALSLIGFLLMDAKSGSKGGGGFFSSLSTNVGKVDGQSIEKSDFDKRYDAAYAAAKQQNAQQQRGEPDAAQIREQVWNQVVAETIFYKEADKLGIEFTGNEFFQLLGTNDQSNPLLRQQGFVDPATGQIDPAKVQQVIANLKKAKGAAADERDEQLIEPARVSSVSSKYYALLTASAYYPTWMQEKDKAEAKNFATISYVSVPYSVISDSTIKVTDAEISSYIDKYPKRFKQEAGRMISYVAFSQAPSASDSAQVKESVEKLKADFAADTNTASFLLKNGSAAQLNKDYIYKSKFQSSVKDTIEKLSKGQVFGPYVESNSFVLAKMVDIKQQPDSVFCRHILIKIADLENGQLKTQIRPDSTAKKLVDSIATAIKNGADFNEMVLKYSDDGGSKNTKGEYRFTKDNTLVDSFYRTVFYEPAGTKKVVLGIDERSYVGYHYIEVLNQYKFEPAYKVGYMVKEIFASPETNAAANNNATKLAGQKSIKDFDAYIAKNGLQKITWPTLVKENDYQLGQLQNARPLIRWAFDASVGDVSEPFNIGTQFIVAVVDKVQSEGTQDAKSARPMVEGIIRNQKKAEIISKNLAANPTLEAASAFYKQQVLTAGADSSITFNSQIIPNLGQEPKVIGAAFNKENQTKVSAPIEGSNGVYIIKVNSVGVKTISPEAEAAQTTQKINDLKSLAGAAWFEGLKNQATIKDNRSKHYQ